MKLNTRVIMTSSALALGIAGIVLTFIPGELLHYFIGEDSGQLQFLVQIMGALYFAFGILNWMTKNSILGGIYNRPLVLANFSHFFIAGLALVKGLISDPRLPVLIWIVGSFYLIFAVLFGLMLFRHPLPEKKSD